MNASLPHLLAFAARRPWQAQEHGFKLQLPEQRYFPSLQGMRGLSALSVLIVHIYLMALHGRFLPELPTWFEGALSTLGNGVALFFIISGFVIPASLIRHGDIRRFMTDRILRIMPVFLVIHLLVFSLGPFIGYKWLSGVGPLRYTYLFLTNLTFTALPLGLPLGQQNAWTLTYEWGFYIFVALAWIAAMTGGARRNWLLPICLTAIALCVYRPICLYFLLGVMLSLYPWRYRFAPCVEIILSPLCLLGFLFCAQFVTYWLAIPPAFFLFLAALQDRSLTSRFLCSRPLQYVGKISYSFYLIHPLAMFPLQLLGMYLVSRGVRPALLFGAFVVFGPVLTLGFSIISYDWLEVRLRGMLSNWIVARRGRIRPAHALAEGEV